MNEPTKEALLVLCEELAELKKEVAEQGGKIEQLQRVLHEHKTNSHAKGCWF